jgi:hypothetical protein
MSNKWEKSARRRAGECLVVEVMPGDVSCAVLRLQIHPSVAPVRLGSGAPEDVAELCEQVVAHLAHLIGQLEDERREAAAGEDW